MQAEKEITASLPVTGNFLKKSIMRAGWDFDEFPTMMQVYKGLHRILLFHTNIHTI